MKTASLKATFFLISNHWHLSFSKCHNLNNERPFLDLNYKAYCYTFLTFFCLFQLKTPFFFVFSPFIVSYIYYHKVEGQILWTRTVLLTHSNTHFACPRLM